MSLPFQSTLPHGSDMLMFSKSKMAMISIHAPSRERQFDTVHGHLDVLISIHAPSRERPCFANSPTGHYFHFNPRSLTGATKIAGNNGTVSIISIHAPSRERLVANSIVGLKLMRFQSTLPHGSDSVLREQVPALWLFQSTLPHGSDTLQEMRELQSHISIHAPSRERPKVLSKPMLTAIFQSTLPRGSDNFYNLIGFVCKFISIHAPSRERRFNLNHNLKPHKISIHAPSRERP